MSMHRALCSRVLPIAFAALLGGCATGYSYHQGDGGDYYSGDPHVEYRYISPGGIGYGYSPYPYGYWGGYYGGRYGGYGYGGGYGYYGWYPPGYWHGSGPYHRYRGPYRPRTPGHNPPPPPVPSTPPGTNPGGGPTGSYDPNDPRGMPDYERPGRKNGNAPLPPRFQRGTPMTPPPAPISRPTPVVRPTPVIRPTPVMRPSVQQPAPMPRPMVTPTVRSERAVERARVKSGAGDTP